MRIILRTGQPGKAPAAQVILDYDIDDYKEKTELTLEKMLVTLISALRSYSFITTIENNRLRCSWAVVNQAIWLVVPGWPSNGGIVKST